MRIVRMRARACVRMGARAHDVGGVAQEAGLEPRAVRRADGVALARGVGAGGLRSFWADDVIRPLFLLPWPTDCS